MLAIIMAGGEGERLRPITCTLPKPMAPVLGRPLMHYALSLLQRHGVTEAAVTLGYLPDKIMDEFRDGEGYGLSLHYYTEKHPLGTAGSVKQAQAFLKETFAVLSGDGICDVNLTEALRFHKEKGALATMVLTHVQNPTEYGLVHVDETGRVVSFLEKPAWQSVNTDTANTGIYILEPEVLNRIPENEPFDFGRQLFPMLVKENEAIYGYTSDSYWCDVGDISAYIQANMDALSGKISLIAPPKDGIFRMPGAIVDEQAVIEAPTFIGSGARIDSNAHIGAHSVIGAHAHVCPGATVKRGILMDGACLLENAQLRAGVLCAHAVLDSGASAFEESVIGESSIVQERSVVRPGIKIWPGKRIPEGEVIASNVVWGQIVSHAFHGSSLHLETPEDAARAARTIAWKMNLKTALIGRSASAVSLSQERAFSAGLSAQGVSAYLVGECTLPLLRCALMKTRLDAAFYIIGTSVTVISKSFIPISANDKRMLEAALRRQDTPPAYTGLTRKIESAGRHDLMYLAHLESAVKGAVRRQKAAIYAQNEQLLYLADHAFARAHFPARVEWEEELMELETDEIGVFLSEDGDKACFKDKNGMLADWENELLLAETLFAAGEREFLAPPGVTREITLVAEEKGLSVRYFDDEYLWAEALSKASEYQFSLRFDGIFCALSVLSALSESGITLTEFRNRLPKLDRFSKTIALPHEKRASALRKFRERPIEGYERDNWYFFGKDGCAWVRPDEDRPLLTVTAEAHSSETAQEICDFFAKLLSDAQKN